MLGSEEDLAVAVQDRTLDSRPTTKGVTMYGKITMSRMGIMGSLRGSFFSRAVVIESS
jgi:hypothetical protein